MVCGHDPLADLDSRRSRWAGSLVPSGTASDKQRESSGICLASGVRASEGIDRPRDVDQGGWLHLGGVWTPHCERRRV